MKQMNSNVKSLNIDFALFPLLLYLALKQDSALPLL